MPVAAATTLNARGASMVYRKRTASISTTTADRTALRAGQGRARQHRVGSQEAFMWQQRGSHVAAADIAGPEAQAAVTNHL